MSRCLHRVTARALPNIALVKYWGKRDGALNLPLADSVSVCLDLFPVTVECCRASGIGDLSVAWNHEKLPAEPAARFRRVLDAVRRQSGQRFDVCARIATDLPSRAGLASSAAAVAAFASAVARLHGLEPGNEELSVLARLGSGSASRSVPGGFAWWHRGQRSDGADSYAEPIGGPDHWPELRAMVVRVSDRPKEVSSSRGMSRTQETSPFFQEWVRQCLDLAPRARQAIVMRDFLELSVVAELSARSLHSLCLTASPPLLYLERKTISVLDCLHAARGGTMLFWTLDAGPNPVVFTHVDSVRSIQEVLTGHFPDVEVQAAGVGPGVRVVNEE